MISVIIPTRNRRELLLKTLKAISAQTFPVERFEVLVIDNGSTDGTFEAAESATSFLPNLRCVSEPQPGLHSGRHRGMKESRGSVLVFADDDIEPLPVWLESVNEAFSDIGVAIVGGKDLPRYESPPPPWIDLLWEPVEHGRYMSYFSLIDLGDKIREISPMFVFGCNFSIRKKVLEELKGFHPDGMPGNQLRFRGDGETHVARMVEELGYKTIYHPGASVYHWVPASRMSADYIVQRAYADGVTQSYCDLRGGHSPFAFHGRINRLKSTVRNLTRGKLHRRINESFWKGYYFHQEWYVKDEAVRQWVHKEHYL